MTNVIFDKLCKGDSIIQDLRSQDPKNLDPRKTASINKVKQKLCTSTKHQNFIMRKGGGGGGRQEEDSNLIGEGNFSHIYENP